MYEYAGKITNVVDADTLDISVDLGFGITASHRFRLLGGDAYETRLGRGTTPEEKVLGLKAKQMVKDIVEAIGDNVKIVSSKQGKYGRYLCTVEFNDGRDLLDILGDNNFLKVE